MMKFGITEYDIYNVLDLDNGKTEPEVQRELLIQKGLDEILFGEWIGVFAGINGATIYPALFRLEAQKYATSRCRVEDPSVIQKRGGYRSREYLRNPGRVYPVPDKRIILMPRLIPMPQPA